MKQKYTAPQTKVAGTVSCRNVDSLLLTLPARARNKKTKIALEIKSTHQFNEDEPYYFIGFDFASQELQFFAMLAATKKYSGEDELERTALLGDSATGTDFHSVTAERSGVSRSLQKNLNYG